MFPQDVQNLIEAYAMDMAIYEELRKTKVNYNIVKRIDGIFYEELSSLMPFCYHAWSEKTPKELADIFQEMHIDNEYILTILMHTCFHIQFDFWDDQTGDWCLSKLCQMEGKRRQIWNDIGICCCDFEETAGNEQFIKKWVDASKYLTIDDSFDTQFMTYIKTQSGYSSGSSSDT